MTDKIQTLIDQMTLAEKAALCTGASAWTTTPVERLDIPRLLLSDGPHGIRRITDIHSMMQTSEPATCFPTASSLAATWDVDLLRQVGEALAEEAIALDVDVVLGPGVNMKRTPLCGRNFEYFSEDPFLAGARHSSILPPTTRNSSGFPSAPKSTSGPCAKFICPRLKRPSPKPSPGPSCAPTTK